MSFRAVRRVRFADCDPAGIVFYPQYLVMLNTLVEQWFDEGLGIPYAGLIGARRVGLPTVRLEVDFSAVSRHGDTLDFELALRRMGRSSMSLDIRCLGAGELRLRARKVLVCTDLDSHRAQPWPDDLLAALRPCLAPETLP